jgi:hypothetical protein
VAGKSAQEQPQGPSQRSSQRSSQLQGSVQADAALSPEQRKYKQLATKIEKAKLELLAWQEQVAWFAQQHHQRMQPLLAELAACQLHFVKRLAALLAGPGRTAVERATMRRALCDQAALLAGNEYLSDAQNEELQALHDLHADVKLDVAVANAEAEAMAEAKAMFEAASGLDLGEEQFDSHEALLARVRQKMDEQAQVQGQTLEDTAPDYFDAQRDHGPGKPTAKQRRKLMAAERDEQQASMSLREVFRKLASALHPDRASDDADRKRRTLMMQRVNQAYAQQDLLGLFALQLEIEQIDPAHLNSASSERMRHYNKVLSSQLQELVAEIEAREEVFCMEYGVEPWLRLKPKMLPTLLNQQTKDLQIAVQQAQFNLQQLDVSANVKRLLKQIRKLQDESDSDEFFVPF